MPSTASETWEGGYVRRDARGRSVFIIRRRISGKQVEVSTRCTTRRAALAELARWEQDPAGYAPRTTTAVVSASIRLSPELIARYTAWQAAAGRAGPDWRYYTRKYLEWWAERLTKDLRRVDLRRDILPHIPEGTPARQHRIAVLKAFYSWLRTVEHSVGAAEDPTLDRLPVPRYDPRRRAKANKAVPRAALLAVLDALPRRWAACLAVQVGTGWHTRELQRFAKAGQIEAPDVLVCPQAKAGGEIRTRVSVDVVIAALELRGRPVTLKGYYSALHAAADARGVARFGPGQLRHTVATWAVDAGADVAAVASFLNHATLATTKRFYATHSVAAKVPTLL